MSNKTYTQKLFGWGSMERDYPSQWNDYTAAVDALRAAVHADHPEAPISWPRGSYGKTTDMSATPALALPKGITPAMLKQALAMLATAQTSKTSNGKSKVVRK